MKNIKEITRGTDSVSLEFIGKRSKGELSFKNETFKLSHPLIVEGSEESGVTSVFERAGDVIALNGDYDEFYSPIIHTHTKDEVGLDEVDNTADLDKPISDITQIALDTKTSNTFIEETLTGDDAGLVITGQVGIGTWDSPQEFVCGEGDSTTDTMVVLNTLDDATFNDNTTAAASDTGSTFWLFGGTGASVAAGSTVYIGSDFKFSGVKAKIIADGSASPDNLAIEYWNGTWQDVKVMSTTSNPPLTSLANVLAQNSSESEQWRFGMDPYERFDDKVLLTIDGNTKYWIRIRIVTDIETDISLEQLKLHTSRFEANGTGATEYFGESRYKKTLFSGVNQLVNNTARSASNQNVTYVSGEIIADYDDNQFNDGVIDSRLFILNVDEGLDTSIPLEFKLSYYVEGTVTGDIEWQISKIPIDDGFVYDGSGSRTGTYTSVDSILTDSNLIRRTVTNYVEIDEGFAGTAYLIEILRDATSTNTADTLADSVVITHLVVNGYYWKP